MGGKSLHFIIFIFLQDVYPMWRKKRGKLLLLNNEDFSEAKANGKSIKNREGTSKDEMALDRLFQKLYFDVKICRNNTAKVRHW